MPKRYQATSANVEDYWQLFVNRRAYVLESMRPHAESGRYYYFRPKAGKNGEAPSLAAETIRRHLEGDLTIGVYAMSPATQRCKWIAMDGDYKDSLKHLCELQWELQQQKVEAALEQSRRGAHLWIFGEQPLLARQVREFGARDVRRLRRAAGLQFSIPGRGRRGQATLGQATLGRAGKLLDQAANTLGLRHRVLHDPLQIGAVARDRGELIAVMLDLAHVEQERCEGAIELSGNGGGHLVRRFGANSIQPDEIELFRRRSAAFVPIGRPRISGRIVL